MNLAPSFRPWAEATAQRNIIFTIISKTITTALETLPITLKYHKSERLLTNINEQ